MSSWTRVAIRTVLAVLAVWWLTSGALMSAVFRNAGSIELVKATVARPGAHRDPDAQLEKMARAESFFERELGRHAEPAGVQRRVTVKLKRAELYAEAGAWKPALAEYDSAVALDANHAGAHLRMGELLVYRLPHTTESLLAATRHLQRLTELNPKFGHGRVVYGHALAASGRTDEALRQVEIAVDLDHNSYFETVLAGFYFSAGRLTQALDHFKSAVTLDETRGDAWLGLARVYRALGEPGPAVVACQQVLRRPSQLPDADACRQLLSDLQPQPGH